jgi:hypothetical protein
MIGSASATPFSCVLASISLIALLVLDPSAARADKCTGAKLKATGKKELGLLACQSKVAAKNDTSGLAACEVKVKAKFTLAFLKAGVCSGDEATCEDVADTCEEDVAAAMTDAFPSKCEAKKRKAAGKLANAELACYAKAAKKELAVDPSCLSKASGRFSTALTKAGTCPDGGSPQALVEDSCVAPVVETDAGGTVTDVCPTTTTTTVTSTTTATTATTTSTTTTTTSSTTSTSCPTMCGGTCTNTATDPNNCGSCGTTCSTNTGTASNTCGGGTCHPSCTPLWGSCDGAAPNGCETPLTGLANCGGCGVGCSRSNASASCATGTCTLGSCNFGYANCDGNNGNGCELVMNGHSDASPGEYLGSYDADAASGLFCSGNSCSLRTTRTGTQGRYFYATAHEGSTCPTYLGVTVQLMVPAGVDYDLYVSGGDNCSGGCSSANGTGQTDTVTVSRNDNVGGDDTFNLFIEVRFFGGASCAPWTLNVYMGGC